MKQELSVLKWASLMMEEEVRNLDCIQNVPFLKTLLWRIDPDYFYQWEQGAKGSQNVASVLSEIQRYFREQINTDIQQYLDTLNIYTNPMDVWELLLGIAIKGNNRGQNITLILDMDHALQAELMGIVSSIIDKFGQNTAQADQDQVEEQLKELEPGPNQQMLLDLVKENEELNEQIDELSSDLEKAHQEKKVLLVQKKEAEDELTRLKHEKLAFIDIMANANRTDSRIFDDGEENVLSAPSLSELANDLTIFVRNLKKKLAQEQEKNSLLEEHVKEIQAQATRCMEDNESYLLQLGNLNAHQHELEQLRNQITDLFQENSDLYDQLHHLQQEHTRLIHDLQARTQEKEMRVSEVPLETQKDRKKRAEGKRTAEKNNNRSGSSISAEEARHSLSPSEEGVCEKNPIRNELREPKLRAKLQREIEFLKNTNQSLRKQNLSLKQSNQSLQHSANAFMVTNKEIVNRWEEDYQELLDKINRITQNSPSQNLEGAKVLEQGQTEEQVVESQEVPGQSEERKEPQLTTAFSFGIQAVGDREEPLWEEISKKLRQIVRKGKEREFALQNTIHQLRSENLQLLTANPGQSDKAADSERQSQEEAPKFSNSGAQEDFRIKLIGTSEAKSQEALKDNVNLSYVSIREGEDMDDSVVEKRRSVGLSDFYNMGSKILGEIKELKATPSQSHLKDEYQQVNRALFKSIRSGLSELKSKEVEDEESSFRTGELEEQLRTEISTIQEHYQQLNSNFQLMFNKLELYSSQVNQAELSKMEYQKVLEKLRMTEEQIKADHQAEIVKLRLLNDQLHQGLFQSALHHQAILDQIGEILQERDCSKKERQASFEHHYQMVLKALQEIQLKYNDAMLEPLNFLSLRLSLDKEGEIQQFYNMYLREKEKCRQLTEELELLSGLLIEYNTLLHQ